MQSYILTHNVLPLFMFIVFLEVIRDYLQVETIFHLLGAQGFPYLVLQGFGPPCFILNILNWEKYCYFNY